MHARSLPVLGVESRITRPVTELVREIHVEVHIWNVTASHCVMPFAMEVTG